MKLPVLLTLLCIVQMGWCQSTIDKNWPKLVYEKDSKLAVYKKKPQAMAYTQKSHYSLGDTILFRVEVNRPVAVNWSDLVRFPSLTYVSSSTSVQHGITSKENRYTWTTYSVKYLPKAKGKVDLNPIDLQLDGKRYRTKKITIKIE
ncbi:BatD family protein [Flavobacteriaceae bacterium F08102]|nr:BatD family protein [Flavobacteriaceae bacterium F08102]